MSALNRLMKLCGDEDGHAISALPHGLPAKAAKELAELRAENEKLERGLDVALNFSTKSMMEIIGLREELEEAKRVIVPFAHPDLSRVLSGNFEGDKSIIFQRDMAKLHLGDFRAAAEWMKNVAKRT